MATPFWSVRVTYYELLNFNGKNITVKSESGAHNTIIDGLGNGTIVTFTHGETRDALLKEFTVTNGYGYGTSSIKGGAFTITGGSSPVIEGCLINNCQAHSGGAIVVSGQDSAPVFEHNVIATNSADVDGGAIYVAENAAPVFFNNLIRNNSAIYGGGVFAKDSSPLFTNNTITKNSASSFGGGLYYLDAAGSIINNIISNQVAGEGIYVYEAAGQPELSHNNVWGNAGDNYGGVAVEGNGDISFDPLFASGPNGIYYLSQLGAGQDEQSPCVNAGLQEAVELELDSFTTRTDHREDIGVVDLGYHYGYIGMFTPTPTPTATPTCVIDSRLMLSGVTFRHNDLFKLQLRLFNNCYPLYIDQFILLEMEGNYWFWPSWGMEPDYSPGMYMAKLSQARLILEFAWPLIDSTYHGARFWCAAFEEGHIDEQHIVGEINYLTFGWTND